MLAGMLSAAYAARFHFMTFGIVKYDPVTNYLPSLGEKAMPLLLAIGSLLLGGLWLAGVHDPLSDQLGGQLPISHSWEILLSLSLVALGIMLGDRAARRRDLGTTGGAAVVADWFALPSAIDLGVIRPAMVLCALAAKADDALIDAGVRATARVGRLVARLGSGAGETITDRLPAYTAKLVGTAGRQAVRIQTGMSHHYYALIAGGVAVVIVMMLWGS